MLSLSEATLDEGANSPGPLSDAEIATLVTEVRAELVEAYRHLGLAWCDLANLTDRHPRFRGAAKAAGDLLDRMLGLSETWLGSDADALDAAAMWW